MFLFSLETVTRAWEDLGDKNTSTKTVVMGDVYLFLTKSAADFAAHSLSDIGGGTSGYRGHGGTVPPVHFAI